MMDATRWRRLWHRWLVEYNPMYLLSAALVLGGVVLLSRGLTAHAGVAAIVGVGAIADVYAWALIGGAALLMRLGLRRPAVMLALITALYQFDPTLHVETCVYLGGVGAAGAALWLAMFVAKLHALAWAVRVRLPASARALAVFGAFGLALLPRWLSDLDGRAESSLVAAWVFASGAAALWTTRKVTSRVPLDDWARTVLGRSVRATWQLWAGLALFHVWFWSDELGVDSAPLLPVAILLGARWVRSEAGVVSVVVGALVLTAFAMPTFFSLVGLFGAVVLALSALRRPRWVEIPGDDEPNAPYRARSDAAPATARREWVFALAERASLIRLVSAALCSTYLSVWTLDWTGGPWPDHRFALDAMFLFTGALLVWKARARAVLVPIATAATHLGAELGIVRAPSTSLGWGTTSVALGFALLVGPLFASWRLMRRAGSLDGSLVTR